jgi:nucleoside 2-deoxyribosyltransferase
MKRPRIYLAGPEVFLPDPIEAGRVKIALAAEYGLEGVYPLDATLNLEGLAKPAQATLISRSNEYLMRSCDAAIANLTPFRSVSADAGTAFEVGFMRALGRPVVGYTNTPVDLAERSRMYRSGTPLPFDCDAPGVAMEDFDLAENLMLEIAIEACGGRLVRHRARPGEEMTDLTGFKSCLADITAILQSRAAAR